MNVRFGFLAGLVLVATGFAGTTLAQRAGREGDPQAVFKRWLEEDVVYIITEPERTVFLSLTTVEEKDRFIEQFWRRRDPTPSTPYNEYKEEHYRRIHFANERYASGRPGWMTDRGRIYIKFGEPDGLERRPTGGGYTRPITEGGGVTTVFPFEIWRYNYIDRVGSNIEIEFVDPQRTGEYRIAMSPQEKDALMTVPGAGMTEFEERGAESRADRILREGLATTYEGPTRDLPFERMARLVGVTRAPEYKFDDLRTVVDTHITYTQLPLQVMSRTFRLAEKRSLVTLTLELPNSSLRFAKEGPVYRAELQVYGRVSTISGKTVQDFEDTIHSEHNEEGRERALSLRSIYQKVIILEEGTYKLDLVVRDSESKTLGTATERVFIPTASATDLACSSIVLASRIEEAAGVTSGLEPFALGNIKVIPNVSATYNQGDIVGVYMHLYGAALDPTTREPALSVRYHLLRDGLSVGPALTDEEGHSVFSSSERRVVLVYGLSTHTLKPGNYRLLVRIKDQIAVQEVTADANFVIQ